MKITDLKKERATEYDAAKAILDKAEGENRTLTQEEQTQWDAHMTRFDELTETLKRAERVGGLAGEFAAQQKTQPPAKPQADQGFRSFGEFLQSVALACSPNGRVDPRLVEERATGLSEGIPADGGFLVQTDFSTELQKIVHETGQVVSKCKRIPISANANGVKINAVAETSRADGSRWGGVQAYWAAEAAVKTKSKPEFRQIELNLKKLIGLCYATDELLQDAAALEAVIRQAFAEEFAFKIDDAIINGLGAGQPLGILACPALVTVAKEVGQANTTIVTENVIKMYARMHARSVRNAVWFVNQDVFPQLYSMSLSVGTGGGPVFMPAGGLSGLPYNTILGRPIIPIEQCATLGTVGDIIFADMSQYLVAEKGGLQSASSIHVMFTYDETVFRFVYRVDGQPGWNSALIPYKGAANTVSPFVVLAGRP